jgi:hypothetical protein
LEAEVAAKRSDEHKNMKESPPGAEGGEELPLGAGCLRLMSLPSVGGTDGLSLELRNYSKWRSHHRAPRA